MIKSEHGYLRGTEEDDSPWFHQLYLEEAPRFALLDLKREPVMPTLMEIRETLGSKEAARSQSYTIENPDGEVAGFIVLRGLQQEGGYCELAVMMLDEADGAAPLAQWATEFALDRAFGALRLRKLTAHTLCREDALNALLLRRGFACDGTQRQVLFSRGRWYDVLSYSLTPDTTEKTCP